VLRQNALYVVSADPVMAAEADAAYHDDESLTVGERMRVIDALCCDVLRRHGYEVKSC